MDFSIVYCHFGKNMHFRAGIDSLLGVGWAFKNADSNALLDCCGEPSQQAAGPIQLGSSGCLGCSMELDSQARLARASGRTLSAAAPLRSVPIHLVAVLNRSGAASSTLV